ncbi:hypothetical protein [Dyadobacter crusticola]|uniref:hypothetical protein n=1 Tax=Dyadobacter crusticola TaxID=292407 RepID=UPI0012FC51F7|nr:hypothetical protein [Dyadobacter crusticola]
MIAFLALFDPVDILFAMIFGALIGIVAHIIYEFNHPLIVSEDYDRPDYQDESDEKTTD